MNSKELIHYDVFAVVFNEESGYDKLRLPLTSTTIHAEKFRDQIFLRDRYENIWPVKIEVVDGDIDFIDGWRAFAKHNYLEDNDVVIFYNGGGGMFDVKILGSDSTDKKGIGRKIIRGEPTISINEFNPNIRNDSHFRRDKAHKHHYASSRKEKAVDPLCGDILRTKSTSKIYPKPYLGRAPKAHYHAPRHAILGKYVDPFGKEFFKSHPDQKPKNPCFVTWLRKDRPATLIVPTKVVTKYKLDLPKILRLKDGKGGTWDAELNNWTDRRHVYGGGAWRNLCRVNFVTHEDVLICEFLRSERRGLHSIHVHIFRP